MACIKHLSFLKISRALWLELSVEGEKEMSEDILAPTDGMPEQVQRWTPYILNLC